jgi:hypothetical protein
MQNKRFLALVGVVIVILVVGAFLALSIPTGHPTTSTTLSSSSSSTYLLTSSTTASTSLSTFATTSFPSFSFTTLTTTTQPLTTTITSSTYQTFTTTTTSSPTVTYGTNASLSCFTNLNETSSTPFPVDNATGYRIVFVNQANTIVVAYVFPPINSTLAPGNSTGYSLILSGNSTFTGVYFYANLAGYGPISGFAGIEGSSYYRSFSSGSTDSTSIRYLVPQGLSSSYVIGVTNAYSSTQLVSGSIVIAATCGPSWISQVSAT